MYPDSWIEVASRPSSSSLSSAGEEIITTGLRLTQSEEQRRRRRLRRSATDWEQTALRRHNPQQEQQQQQYDDHSLVETGGSGGGSSQEEYEESESESDRVMSSSNEGIHPLPITTREEWQPRNPMSSTSSENAYASNEEDDRDDIATAIGVAPPTDTCFTPQPNAFTYIPSSSSRPSTASAVHQQSLQMPEAVSYFPPQRPNARPTAHRHSFPASQPPQHSPFNVISPSHRIDHDAALRASLNTLLSCAAAARGLPKTGSSEVTARRLPSNRIDTSTLRMVPESIALGGGNSNSAKDTTSAKATVGSTSGQSSAPSQVEDKSKRKANIPTNTTAAPRSSSKERRVTKKPRRASAPSSHPSNTPAFMDDLSPTLLTWALSAGVVVLVSALSFSAGYVVGREVGKTEAEAAAHGFVEAIAGGGTSGPGGVMSCGNDFVREGGLGMGMGSGTGLGLRRLRFTGGGSVVQV